jgi:hypothetical protein
VGFHFVPKKMPCQRDRLSPTCDFPGYLTLNNRGFNTICFILLYKAMVLTKFPQLGDRNWLNSMFHQLRTILGANLACGKLLKTCGKLRNFCGNPCGKKYFQHFENSFSKALNC